MSARTRRSPAGTGLPNTHHAVLQTLYGTRASTSPPIEQVLAGLSGVRQTGPDRWIACCPAHDDKRASLSIRYTGDRVLLHCFSSCDLSAVIGALGLTAADLFAERLPGRESRRAPPIPAIDALRILSQEAIAVVVIANDLARGETLTDELRYRLTTAARRMGDAVAVCNAP